MYRPGNWENGWDKEREHDGMLSKAEIFEAGADAIVGSLLDGDEFISVSKGAIIMPGFLTDLDEYARSLGNGRWVFIPGKEDEKNTD